MILRSLSLLPAVLACALAALAPVAVRGALNPDSYLNVASDQLRLREIARVVANQEPNEPKVRRVTIVAEVVTVVRSSHVDAGDVIVIDYVVDLDARDKAGAAFAQENGARPGPQFLYEPDPPTLDENKEFWANLAPAATRLANVQRHAGARVEFRTAAFVGPVFVPVSAQYSFNRPPNAERAK